MLVAVGGIGTAAGNVLWHVVGCEETIKEWSTVYRLAGHRLSQEMASGVLVGYLGGERQWTSGERLLPDLLSDAVVRYGTEWHREHFRTEET